MNPQVLGLLRWLSPLLRSTWPHSKGDFEPYNSQIEPRPPPSVHRTNTSISVRRHGLAALQILLGGLSSFGLYKGIFRKPIYFKSKLDF